MIAPALILVEVAAAISRSWGDKNAARQFASFLENFASLSILTMDPRLVSDAIQMSVQNGLRAGDAFYAVVAQNLNVPFVSFDEDIHKKIGHVITVIKP